MALYKRPLMSTSSESALTRMQADRVGTGKLLAGTAVTYVEGTPLTWTAASNGWEPWDGNVANTPKDVIYGFLYQESVTRHATEDVIVAIMTAGEIHYNDVLTAVEYPATDMGSEAEMVTAFKRADFREKNLRVAGFSDVSES